MTTRHHAQLRIAADLAILTVREGALHALVITRGNEPFAGKPALPGGFVRTDEDLDAAAVRELREETCLNGADLHLEQFGVYGEPHRDPRGRVVSVAYLAIMPNLPWPSAGSDASGAAWVAVDRAQGNLAFDHDRILYDAVERARQRLELTTLATAFCPPEFTIGDLRSVYEVVWGETLDPRNFSRKVINTEGFIEPTGRKRVPATGRPAALYRAGNVATLNPPILRPSTDS
ncbi:8-oxo-dGTP diphosphatase [Micromonospora matsumotoense]|uniref:8-oxo-dGTP diphosphatase n=1 Tax=Micromonospora matsumotoense TaxID=121616 RepID=A0A1C5AWC0_9ACTN|nr:NUDIX domain-containing protein [Micromonospora matsumotoense]SCF49519.1 8-oxo-dGTP diphosphatase [Micromonospora matsumotoense]